MSRSYKFHNPQGIYFISFAVVDWLDVFTRRMYKDILVDSLKYCQENKDLKLFCWCIMTNHVHLIAQAGNEFGLSGVLRDFKKFTSSQLIRAIEENPSESRKEIFLERFKLAGNKNSNNRKYQFWRQDNKPIELWSNSVIEQKMNYVHDNPIVAGFAYNPEGYPYSSARYISEGEGMLKVEPL